MGNMHCFPSFQDGAWDSETSDGLPVGHAAEKEELQFEPGKTDSTLSAMVMPCHGLRSC